MEEKVYKTMKTVGGANIALGIIVLVCGVASGVLMIVNGARLLKKRGTILF